MADSRQRVDAPSPLPGRTPGKGDQRARRDDERRADQHQQQVLHHVRRKQRRRPGIQR